MGDGAVDGRGDGDGLGVEELRTTVTLWILCVYVN